RRLAVHANRDARRVSERLRRPPGRGRVALAPARPLAVPLLALQREGALGARLEGHRARAPLAPARLPHPARPLDDGAEVAAGPGARRRDDPRFDAHHRAPRARAARAGALPGRRGCPPAGARARGLLRRGARPAPAARALPRAAAGARVRGRRLPAWIRAGPPAPLPPPLPRPPARA